MSSFSHLRSQGSGANPGALVLIIAFVLISWAFVTFYVSPPWDEERTGLLIAYVATYVSVVAGFASVRGVWVDSMGWLSLLAALVAIYAVGAAPATALAETSGAVPWIVAGLTAIALSGVEVKRRRCP